MFRQRAVPLHDTVHDGLFLQAGVGHRQYLRGDIRVQALDLRVQRVNLLLRRRQLLHVPVIAVKFTAHLQPLQQEGHLLRVLRGQRVGQRVHAALQLLRKLIAAGEGHLALLRRQYLGGYAAGAEVVQRAHALRLPPYGHQRQ